MPNQLGESQIKKYCLDFIWDDLEEIKELNRENKDFQILRERVHDEEKKMMIREILFLNARCIKRLKERIEDVKATIKKLS